MKRSYPVSSPPAPSPPSPPQQSTPLYLVKEVIKDSSGVSVHVETVVECSSLDEAKKYITKEAEGWEEQDGADVFINSRWKAVVSEDGMSMEVGREEQGVWMKRLRTCVVEVMGGVETEASDKQES
jgi:hypothetical protein